MAKSAPHLIAAGISLVVLIFFLCGVGGKYWGWAVGSIPGQSLEPVRYGTLGFCRASFGRDGGEVCQLYTEPGGDAGPKKMRILDTALAFSILGFIFSLIMLCTTLCMGLGLASEQRSLLGLVSAVLAVLCFLWGLIAWAVWVGQYREGLAKLHLPKDTLKPSWAWAFVFLASILSLINAPICMLKGSD